MAWDRAPVAKALQAVLTAALDATNVYDRPPQTVNPPAVVIGWPTEVRYSAAGLGSDEARLPVICVAPADGDDVVSGLIQTVRDAIAGDLTLGGVVQSAVAAREHNWRAVAVAGIELLQAEVELAIVV